MSRGMIALPGVTLACVDTLNQALALRALQCSRERIRFARTVLLTDRLPPGLFAPDGVDVVPIEPIRSRDAYSRLVLKRLLPHVTTPHLLLVQWDGYVLNPEAWDPAFADCDYLGARWLWHIDGHDVGNGGFSLRSRRLLEALQDPRIELDEAEDVTIGRTFRNLLEREYGIRFGSAALADRFAFEAAYPIGRPFGFHGLYNFCRVMPPAALAALAGSFSDTVARSVQLAQLLRNCVALGQWQPAIAIAKRILAAEPGHGEAATLLRNSEAALARGAGIGRNDPCPCGSGKRFKQCHGAVTGTGAPLAAAAPSADVLVARALVAHQRGELDAAVGDYRAALDLEPGHPHAMHYLGVSAYQCGDAAGALPMLERAVVQVPHEPEFHNNLGLAYAALDRNQEAVAAHRRALVLKPDHAGAWNNLGLVLQAQNDLDGAIDAFRQALSHAPKFAEARFNFALALLAAGRFAEAWPHYDSRLEIAAFAPASVPPTPRWDGHDAAGRTLLLNCEQGLGDAIQFIRLASPLAGRGARVVVQAPAALVALFRTVEGVSEVVPTGAPLPPHDAWLPLLSLAGALGINAGSIPVRVPYVAVEPARRREVAATLRAWPDTLRAGIAWAGNPRHSNDRRRSAPLAFVARLLDMQGVTWFSLQQGHAPPAAEAPALARLVPHPYPDDFDGTAALIAELDLVVTVDTSLAHLAGALARPVFIALPFASDWRWRTSRTDSDWYPTATLFRQPAPGDWMAVLATLRNAIRALAVERESREPRPLGPPPRQ